MFTLEKGEWCPGEDSNLHALRHTDLNRARLPIPPPGQVRRSVYAGCPVLSMRFRADLQANLARGANPVGAQPLGPRREVARAGDHR